MTLNDLIPALLAAHVEAVEDGVVNPAVQILLEVEMFSEIQAANGDIQGMSYHEGVITISGVSGKVMP